MDNPIIRNRDIHGDYNHLIAELRKDAQLFKKYFRLTVITFTNELVKMSMTYLIASRRLKDKVSK